MAAPALNFLMAPALASAVFKVKSTILDKTSTLPAVTVELFTAVVEVFCSSFQIAEPEISDCTLSNMSPILLVTLPKNFLFNQS